MLAIGHVLLIVSVLTTLASFCTTYFYSIEYDSVAKTAVESVLVSVCTVAQLGLFVLSLMHKPVSTATVASATGIFALYSVMVVLLAARMFATSPIKGLTSQVDSAYSRVYIYLFIILAFIGNLFQCFGPSLLISSFSSLSWMTLVGGIICTAALGIAGAATYVYVNRLTPDDVLRRVGALKQKSTVSATPLPTQSVWTGAPLPEAFDCRQKWANQLSPLRNQQSCGSCVAFASSSVLADRWAIANKSPHPILLSPQYILQTYDDYKNEDPPGCSGAYLSGAMEFLYKQGTVLNSCFPYQHGTSYISQNNNNVLSGLLAGSFAGIILTALLFALALSFGRGQLRGVCAFLGGATAITSVATGTTALVIGLKAYDKSETVIAKKECKTCTPDACVDGSALQMYKFSNVYGLGNDISTIKQEIMTNGPVVAQIDIYSDFPTGLVGPNYVYTRSSSATYQGAHAIRIVGWQKGSWIIFNQWGLWGSLADPGHISIAYGQVGIEDNVYAGVCTAT